MLLVLCSDRVVRRVWTLPAERIALLPRSRVLIVGNVSHLHALRLAPYERKSGETGASAAVAGTRSGGDRQAGIVTVSSASVALTGARSGLQPPCLPEHSDGPADQAAFADIGELRISGDTLWCVCVDALIVFVDEGQLL